MYIFQHVRMDSVDKKVLAYKKAPNKDYLSLSVIYLSVTSPDANYFSWSFQALHFAEGLLPVYCLVWKASSKMLLFWWKIWQCCSQLVLWAWSRNLNLIENLVWVQHDAFRYPQEILYKLHILQRTCVCRKNYFCTVLMGFFELGGALRVRPLSLNISQPFAGLLPGLPPTCLSV